MGAAAEVDAGQYCVCNEHSGIDVYGWVGDGGVNHGAKRRPGEKAAAFIRDVGSVCDYIGIITAIGFTICGWGLSVVFREISAFADVAAVGAGDGISSDTADTGNGDGSTLPLLGRYVTALQNRVGQLVGRLYALNMLGAAMGCFLAGFVLIRMVGVMGTLYIAAGINLLVAFGGWVLSRFYDVACESPPEVTVTKKPVVATDKAANLGLYVLTPAIFASGLISIGYELIWMRSIIFLVGGFTYVFSAVLTIYLLGNVVGVWIGSRLSKRLKLPAVGFAVSLTCLGILGIFYIPLLGAWFSMVEAHGVPLFGGLLTISSIRITILPLFHSTFLFFVPALYYGNWFSVGAAGME